MRKRVNADPITTVEAFGPLGDVNDEGLAESVRFTESQRYPPLPRYAGFNVFGPLETVLFHRVHGGLAIGNRALDLSSSADIELNDVRGFRNANDQERLVAPLATSTESASLQFSAVGKVKINGVQETTFLRRHAPELAKLGGVATLVGALIGALRFAAGLIHTRRGREQNRGLPR